MYCEFYQMRERPFNVTADPKFLYLNARYREALASLHYGITQRKGFITLIGEAGTGKTTLLKKLLDNLDQSTRTVFVFNTNVTFDEILEYIFGEFDLPVHNGRRLYMLQRLNAFLLDELGKGRNVALLIDEAQDLDYSVLEDLRLLSNLETAKEKILQIVLSGQPELGQKLGNPGLRQLRQRVAVNCRLLPLTRDELSEYIQSRLTAAGAADPKLFTRDAEERIFEISTGIPRLVNIVCDNALVIGYALGKKRIGADVVNEAAADLLTMDRDAAVQVAEVAAPAAAESAARSRRVSQIGVIAVVVVALVIGLLSVGRSLLRREAVGERAAGPRSPLEVIQPGLRAESVTRLAAPPAGPAAVEPSDAAPSHRQVPAAGADDTAPPQPVEAKPAPDADRDTLADPRAAAAPPPQPVHPVSVGQALEQHVDLGPAPGAAVDAPVNPAAPNPVGWQPAPDVPAGETGGTGQRAGAAPAVPAAVEPVHAVAQPVSGPAAPEPAFPALAPLQAAAVRAREERLPPHERAAWADASEAPAASGDPSDLRLVLPRYQLVMVKPGDSVSHIATRTYGQASPTILDLMKMANPSIRDIDIIAVGQELRLPQLDEGLAMLQEPDGQFALLLLSTPIESRAREIGEALRRHGFDAQVGRAEFSRNNVVWRVLIGELPDRSAAQAVGRQLQRLFREDTRIAAMAE